MSNIHILQKDTKDKIVNCIFHIDVPDTDNAVGTNWRTAVQRYLNPEPQMSYNNSTENAKITAGEILEVVETVRFSSINLTNAQRLAEIEIAYNTRKTELLQELQAKLDFFGKEA